MTAPLDPPEPSRRQHFERARIGVIIFKGMAPVTSPEDCFRRRWPSLWSLLNNKAQHTLPTGLREYAKANLIVNRGGPLDSTEIRAAEMISILGPQKVSHAYSKDLSGYTSEPQVEEFAAELLVCLALSRSARTAALRPRVPGQSRRPDIGVVIAGYPVFAEVKRYRDPGPGQYGRSMALSEAPGRSAKPRMMGLREKLENVPEQLPDRKVNALFIFHLGIGENRTYIEQSLYGHLLGGDGLFAEPAWRNISAAAYVTDNGSVLNCSALWQNPNALVPLPNSVRVTIQELK